MTTQVSITQRMVVEGKPLLVSLIQNPTIDDVLVAEMEIQASAIETGDQTINSRKVVLTVRDYLIRLGIE